MESLRTRDERQDNGMAREAIRVEEDDSTEMCQPGIEQYITSQVILGLLGIPEAGLVRISSALLMAGNNEVCAYWWRDVTTGEQHAEFRDPLQVKAALSNVLIDSGYLPPNVIRLGIGNGVQWLAIYVPPASYEIVLSYEREREADRTIRVGLPGFVFAGRGISYWMWAVKDGYPSLHSPLYRMPLPNVDGDGTLCYGMNTLPKADGPTIMHALHLFVASKFNDHWAIGKAWSHPGDIREMLSTIAKQEHPTFPNEELVPMILPDVPGIELTLDQAFKLINKRRM